MSLDNLELFPVLATDFMVKSLNPDSGQTCKIRRFKVRAQAEAQAVDWALTQGGAYLVHGVTMTAWRSSRDGLVRSVRLYGRGNG